MARILFLSETYTVHDRRFLPCPRPATSLPPVQGIHELPPLIPMDQHWSLRAWYQAIKATRAHVRSIEPEIVHAGPIPTGTLIAALAGARPLLAMSWGSDILAPENRTGARGWRIRYALRHADMAS